MKKKVFMVLGVALVLLSFLTLYSFISGMGAQLEAIKEAKAADSGVTGLYMEIVRDVVIIVSELAAAVGAFVIAFEDGTVGYAVVEAEEEEEEAEREDPEEQVARMEAERAAREEQAKKPRGLGKKAKARQSGEETPASPEPPQEPCLQCRTCEHRTAEEDRCKVYDRKPGYIRNNRFACNDYREKKK